jgi:peptidoglycan/LPS O-acetylase OafA/YrhL
LTYLGRISYSFYLWHFAILLCFTPRFFGFLNGIGPVSTDAARCIGLLATVAVTIGVSDLSFRFIEKPSIQLGKKLNLLVSGQS